MESGTLSRDTAWAMSEENLEVAPLRRGYEDARPIERAAFWMLSSFGLSIGVARAITYHIERGRLAPAWRDRVRRVYHSPGRERLRVHHFLPGMALALLAGGAAIVKRDEGQFWLGVSFGTGVGLTMDEIALLTERDNPYWESGRLVLGQAAMALLGAVGLGLRFHRHGAAGLRE
jgi:hypothetical protein